MIGREEAEGTRSADAPAGLLQAGTFRLAASRLAARRRKRRILLESLVPFLTTKHESASRGPFENEKAAEK
jgi:hypothetical protein